MNIEHILDSNGGSGFKSFVVKKLKQHNVDFYKINFAYEKGTNKVSKKKYQELTCFLEEYSFFITIKLNTRNISLYLRNEREHHYRYKKRTHTYHLIGCCYHGLNKKSKFYWMEDELK